MTAPPPSGKLTKNQTLVLDVLTTAKIPLSAYSILDDLRSSGFRAPLQVYRALEKLMAAGLVHRLESLNSFVACQHPDCSSHNTIAFTICNDCERVSEITNDMLTQQLCDIANVNEFQLSKSTVELRGTCDACSRH